MCVDGPIKIVFSKHQIIVEVFWHKHRLKKHTTTNNKNNKKTTTKNNNMHVFIFLKLNNKAGVSDVYDVDALDRWRFRN